MASKRKLNGFSLAELVTVIVIVTMLAAIALPKLNQQATDASYFASQVASSVRYAQKQAIAQRRSVFVVVSAAEVKLCYDGAACASPVRDVLTGNAYVAAAPSGVTLTASSASFSFNGLGQPSVGATITVGGKTITVMAETGYVTLG